MTPDDIIKVEMFGSGEFHVEKFETEKDGKGCPFIKSFEFRVYINGGFKPEMI